MSSSSCVVRKRCLILGGTGLVGQHLVRSLADERWDVTVLARHEPVRPCTGADYVTCDRHSAVASALLTERCWDIVFDHCAYGRRDVLFVHERLQRGARYILLSSIAVYPAGRLWQESACLPEDAYRSVHSYALEKRRAEIAALASDIVSTIIRLPFVVGHKDGAARFERELARLVQAGVAVVQQPDALLSLVGAEEAAGCLRALALHDDMAGIWNVCATGEIPVERFLRAVAKRYCGHDIAVISGGEAADGFDVHTAWEANPTLSHYSVGSHWTMSNAKAAGRLMISDAEALLRVS